MSYSELPHLRSNVAGAAAALAPSVAVGTGAGSGATATVAGSDQAGIVTVHTAGTPAAGVLATVTFATPYVVLPNAVSVDAGDIHSASAQLYAVATATTLTISAANVGTLAASQTLALNYVVLGGV